MRLLQKGSYVWGVLKFSINGAGKKGLSAVPLFVRTNRGIRRIQIKALKELIQ